MGQDKGKVELRQGECWNEAG